MAKEVAATQQVQKVTWWQWIVLVIAAVSLFGAQSSYWVRHVFFDRTEFTTIATSAVQEQSSRDAIAAAIVDKALENRPVLRDTIGDRMTSLVSGVLASDLGDKVITSGISKTQAYLITPNREDVAINLTTIKETVATLTSLSEAAGREPRIDAENIPDEIVLLDKDTLPDLSGLARLMIWLAPLLWLLAIGGLTAFIALGRASYARRVYIVYGVVVAVAAAGLFMGPFVPPAIATLIVNINIQTVAMNLTTALLEPFVVQMGYMFGFSTIAVFLFWQRGRIARAAGSVASLGRR